MKSVDWKLGSVALWIFVGLILGLTYLAYRDTKRNEAAFWKGQAELNRFQRAINVCAALPNIDKAQECLDGLENIERQYELAIKKLDQERQP